jgi:5-methylthioadenosine/S-adenosylhomocysteine deaminase
MGAFFHVHRRIRGPVRFVAVVCGIIGLALHAASVPQPVSLVVTGATVITMDPAKRVLSPGAVAIDGTRIVAVGSVESIAAQYAGKDVVQADGSVVLPGLINTHTHAAMVLFRGLADDLALMDWLERYIFPAEAKTVSPEFVRAGTRLAVLEMLQSGTTLFADMYDFEEEVARAAKAAGIRGVLGETVIGFPVADAKTPAESLARIEQFVAEFKGDSLIVPAVAPHSMYTVDAASLRAVRALATRLGVPILTHLAETRDEIAISQQRHGMSPTAYFDSLGFWGPDVLAAHAIWVSDADIALLRTHGVGLAHNPESNMKLASGTAPVAKQLAAGLHVGLGTDGAASNNDLDMFEVMRMTALVHKLIDNDPQSMPAQQVLEMATIGGAQALGMADRLGSLEPGKLADLIIVSMKSARQTPLYNPVSHLVYVTHGDDVVTTIINGAVVMRDRQMLTMDAARAIADGNGMAARVKAAVGQSSAAR